MNLKLLSTLFLTSIITFTGFAQTPSQRKAHLEAHKQQLANHKSKLDKSVIGNLIQEEIMAREEREDGLTPENANLINDLLKEAQTHIGKRYVWGSKGPSTFDCSGFAGYVYRQFGFTMGADSRAQYLQGKPVDRNNLRKGDLVFFTSRRSGKNVGHVGIVWEVDKENNSFKFIHASTRGGVMISDFEGYYVGRYIGAKRLIE